MDEISQKLITHLTDKWGAAKCPMCKSGPWEVQAIVFGLDALSPGYIASGLPTMPLIPIVCRNCAYTVLINAKGTGLFTDEFLNNYNPQAESDSGSPGPKP